MSTNDVIKVSNFVFSSSLHTQVSISIIGLLYFESLEKGCNINQFFGQCYTLGESKTGYNNGKGGQTAKTSLEIGVVVQSGSECLLCPP